MGQKKKKKLHQIQTKECKIFEVTSYLINNPPSPSSFRSSCLLAGPSAQLANFNIFPFHVPATWNTSPRWRGLDLSNHSDLFSNVLNQRGLIPNNRTLHMLQFFFKTFLLPDLIVCAYLFITSLSHLNLSSSPVCSKLSSQCQGQCLGGNQCSVKICWLND